MQKKFIYLVTFLLIGYNLVAQNNSENGKPKLVVGLVVDQMRWDYLYRYHDLYGNDGFKRLLNDGFSCENTFIPYVPTYTAPGHTCVYTGSVPAIHGIVGNEWYSKSLNKGVYCTEDSTVATVGSNSSAGKMSPKNLWVSTITDELRLANNFRNKVIGIALKDRGAILPAGHAANAAYWFDAEVGGWISSTYYQDALPEWVVKLNAKNYPAEAMSKDWNTLLPIEKYSQSSDDNKIFEGKLPDEEAPVFPHRLSKIGKSKFSAFKYTPFAATYTFDMAKAAIQNEKLGDDKFTDMLTISISSTDYAGHAFGPNSIEVEDTYLRLDKDIADFLRHLDATVGKGNYLLFLTADHAAAQVPGFLKDYNIPSGTFSGSTLYKGLQALLENKFDSGKFILAVENSQVYLDYNAIAEAGKNAKEVENEMIHFLKEQPFIDFAFATEKIQMVTIPGIIQKRLINGYHPKRSGDIGFVTKPGYFSGGSTGTTHGSWNPYDSHIPLVWYGTNIKPGKSYRQNYMTDIAPTIAALLNIQMPNGNVGNVIVEVIK